MAKEAVDHHLQDRSLLVGASVVVIVLGTFKMAMTLLDSGGLPQCRHGKFQRAGAFGPIARG